jgi:hypothetical protein
MGLIAVEGFAAPVLGVAAVGGAWAPVEQANATIRGIIQALLCTVHLDS